MTDLEKAQAKIIEMNGLIGANAKDDRYYDALAGLDEDQRKAQFRDYEGEGGALARQIAQAEALQGTAAPQGQQMGGQFVASNPLEHLGSLANQAVGHYKGNKAEGKLEQLGKDKWGTNKDLAMANIDFVRKQRAEAEALKALQ
ncbi:MAG: hypothetical protein IZT57_04570 [Chloroflexi bacterium]|nr:hypothetical protein [Chloroflexota bacterium]